MKNRFRMAGDAGYRVLVLAAWCLACLLTSGSAHALDPVPTDVREANNQAGVMLGARYVAYEELNNGLVATLPQGSTPSTSTGGGPSRRWRATGFATGIG